MHRGSCSTRALEVFVKDFAGFDLVVFRRQRAQHFFQHSRSFNTRPPVRQIKPTVHQHTNDGFVPFELGNSGIQGLTRSDKLTKETDFATHETEIQDDGDAEWHAEVDISDSGMLQAESTPRRSDTIDAIRVPDTALEVATGEDAPVLHLPAISQHVFQGSTQPLPQTNSPPRMKNASRKLRKARRIEAGTFRPAASPRLTVLDKIAMIKGPSTVEEASELAIEETAGKAVAKGEVSRTARSKASRSAKAATKRTRTTKTTKTADVNAGSTKPSSSSRAITKPMSVKKEAWQVQKAALDRKFAEHGWQPRKRLSPDTLEGIRALHASDPASYSTATLAEHFQITPEAIRRVLRSKWRPKPEEIEDRMKRWENRGLRKWEEMSALGVKPPKRWREMGVPNPVLKRKLQSRMKKQSDDAVWKRAEDLADRLPFEGSFAERLS